MWYISSYLLGYEILSELSPGINLSNFKVLDSQYEYKWISCFKYIYALSCQLIMHL